MKYWKKLTNEEIKNRVFNALKHNIDFDEKVTIGIPGSHLDGKVFRADSPILDDAPYLTTLVHNPNHIGCHTIGDSEPFFKGTQDIERELIKLLAEDMFKGDEDDQDGYVASGGTEANIQACWIYRNYYKKEFKADISEICIITSDDAHYSMPKAANVLNVDILQTPVDEDTREIIPEKLDETISKAVNNGKKYFIVVVNMATTMFGSVDNPQVYANALNKYDVQYKMHADGAYGGFIYPITDSGSVLNFANPLINSITIDAHKMLQAPYGTGIFLIRKGYMQYAITEEAQYVSGLDITLIGSRSGANAVAVWMILMTYGPYGWLEKLHMLIYRTDRLCRELDKHNIKYYRHKHMNIVTIKKGEIPDTLAKKYGLVPDTHGENNNWWKIVVMDHVTLNHLVQFTDELPVS